MQAETVFALSVLAAILLAVSAIITGTALIFGFAATCIVGGSLGLVVVLFFLYIMNQ